MKLNNCFKFIFVILMLTMTIGSIYGKTMYVISDINQNPSPIQAYEIAGNSLNYLAQYSVPYYGWGAVGLAIDADSLILFITYESSNIIQLVDAQTMTSEGTTTAPNASNLAGIVVDHDNHKIYTMDRQTNHLYIYSWDPVTKILTNDISTSPYYVALPSCYQAYGLARVHSHSIPKRINQKNIDKNTTVQ